LEQGAEETVLTEERESDRRLEKITYIMRSFMDCNLAKYN
jgi:hypothetical protein